MFAAGYVGLYGGFLTIPSPKLYGRMLEINALLIKYPYFMYKACIRLTILTSILLVTVLIVIPNIDDDYRLYSDIAYLAVTPFLHFPMFVLIMIVGKNADIILKKTAGFLQNDEKPELGQGLFDSKTRDVLLEIVQFSKSSRKVILIAELIYHTIVFYLLFNDTRTAYVLFTFSLVNVSVMLTVLSRGYVRFSVSFCWSVIAFHLLYL